LNKMIIILVPPSTNIFDSTFFKKVDIYRRIYYERKKYL